MIRSKCARQTPTLGMARFPCAGTRRKEIPPGSAIFSSARKSEGHQPRRMRGDRNIGLSGGDVVKWGRTKCERRAKPHGKRSPGAQLWLRKQTIPKSANTIPACATRGSRCRKDASPSTFLTCVILAFVLIFASGLEWFGSASAAIDRPRVRSETSEHDAADEQIKENDHRTAVDGHPKFNP